MGGAVKNIPRTAPFLFALLLATQAEAQTSTPATPLSDLDGFSLPSSRPTPRVAPDAEPTTGASAPRPTVTPTPAPAAPVVAAPVPPPRVVPTVRVTPVARPSSEPGVTVRARPAPVATPTPVAAPTPAALEPVPTPTAAPVAVVSPTPDGARTTPVAPSQTAQRGEAGTSWVWLVVGGLGVAIAGFLAVRRRKGDPNTPTFADVADDVADAPLVTRAEPAPVATAALESRARLEIDCVATRAGTNLLSVAVDYRIVVRNVGDALASGIRLDLRLLGMGAQHDALLDALFALPIEKSIAAPFDLPPGTAVDLSGMAMHPKETIETVEIGGRRMVVPLLSVNVRYGWPDGGAGQTARPFVIGVDPGTGGRLQPFRIDSTARMVQNIAIIAYTDGVTR